MATTPVLNDPYFDPNLDLVLQRDVDVARELVWKAWTEPRHLEKWFCPRPWHVSDIVMELKPGGRFTSIMHGPNGETVPNNGCCLEVVPQEKLVFTDALTAGYRPGPQAFMVAIVTMQSLAPGKTRYTAVARHGNPETRKKHEEMGFHQGWGTALDQMVELIKKGL
jgi:uncharacterized protein YndB with AHSA1/START domain